MLDETFSRLYPSECVSADFDEAAFLAATEATGTPPGERLRLLAIWQESQCPPVDLEGWALLERLYELAIARDSENADIQHSKGVAALGAAGLLDADQDREIARLRGVARAAFERALALQPEEADLLYAMGSFHYEVGEIGQAEEWFRRALEREPERPCAQLYLAHCLQDQGEWAKAIEAYQQIDRARLAAALSPWRVNKLGEQLALCRLKLGQREQALAELSEILGRYEALEDRASPVAADLAYPDELVEAAATELRSELFERVARLVDRMDWNSLYDGALGRGPG